MDFARFLEVEEVKEVMLMPTQFWERYRNVNTCLCLFLEEKQVLLFKR